MPTTLFVSYTSADLDRSKTFYTALGAAFEPKLSDENAVCLKWDDNIFFMLLFFLIVAATTEKRNQAGHHVAPAITHIGTAVASVPITRQTMRRHSEPIS